MPLVKIENINEDCSWGLWKIDENLEVLHKVCLLSPEEKTELGIINNPARKNEWLAARALLKVIMERYGTQYYGILKNEFSKPYLINNGFHISLAHSYPVAGAIVNRIKPCGIDIEKPKPALFQIASKFLSETEISYIQKKTMDLCLAWASKEVMYKLYGRKKVSFKKNFRINPFQFNQKGQITGLINYDEESLTVQLKYEVLGETVICYSI